MIVGTDEIEALESRTSRPRCRAMILGVDVMIEIQQHLFDDAGEARGRHRRGREEGGLVGAEPRRPGHHDRVMGVEQGRVQRQRGPGDRGPGVAANCLPAMVKIVNDEFGIVKGLMGSVARLRRGRGPSRNSSPREELRRAPARRPWTSCRPRPGRPRPLVWCCPALKDKLDGARDAGAGASRLSHRSDRRDCNVAERRGDVVRRLQGGDEGRAQGILKSTTCRSCRRRITDRTRRSGLALDQSDRATTRPRSMSWYDDDQLARTARRPGRDRRRVAVRHGRSTLFRLDDLATRGLGARGVLRSD